MVYMRLNEVCAKGRSALRQKDIENDGPYPVYGAPGIIGSMSTYQNEEPYVAVVKDGAGVGRANICKGKSSVLGTMQALLPNEKVSCEYLLHLVRYMKLGDGFSGSTIPHIYFKDYGKIEVPIPSRNEQAKIVASLSRIENLVSVQAEAISKLDELVKSRFVEMFGDPEGNPMGWPVKTIGELATDVRYGTSKPAVEGGLYTYIRMNNMTYEGELDLSDTKTITLEGEELEKAIVRKGDLLFNRTNSRDHVGKTCVFKLDEPMVIAGYIIRVRLCNEVLPDYLSAFLNSKYGKRLLKSMAHGAVNQANINAQEMKSIEVPVPPVALQKEYLALLQQVDKLKFAAQKQIDELQTLYDSLAQEYFGGQEA